MMAIRIVPLACTGPNGPCCRIRISEDQLAGRDESVGSWRVECVDCQRETDVGFVIKYGVEAQPMSGVEVPW